jgi:hypothetical protein
VFWFNVRQMLPWNTEGWCLYSNGRVVLAVGYSQCWQSDGTSEVRPSEIYHPYGSAPSG